MGWISALVAGLGSIGGAALGSKGAKDASKAQAQASREQLALQRGIYNSQIRNQEPFRATGYGANNVLAQLYGLPYYDYSPAQGLEEGGTGYSMSAKEVRNLLKAGVPFDRISQMGTLNDLTAAGSKILSRNVRKYIKGDNMNALAQQYGVDLTGKKKQDRRALTGAITAALYNPSGASSGGIPPSDLGTGSATGGAFGGDSNVGGQPPAGIPGFHEGTGRGDLSFFTNSPGYEFRLKEGLRAVQNSAAARGGLGGGNSLRAVNDYAQGTASDDFYNFVNQMNNMAGTGQTAVANQNAAGSQFAIGGANALGNYGDARASGIANAANMWGQGITGAGNAFADYWSNRKK